MRNQFDISEGPDRIDKGNKERGLEWKIFRTFGLS